MRHPCSILCQAPERKAPAPGASAWSRIVARRGGSAPLAGVPAGLVVRVVARAVIGVGPGVGTAAVPHSFWRFAPALADSSPGFTLASMPVRSMPQSPFSGLLDSAGAAAVAGTASPSTVRSAGLLQPARARQNTSYAARRFTKAPCACIGMPEGRGGRQNSVESTSSSRQPASPAVSLYCSWRVLPVGTAAAPSPE